MEVVSLLINNKCFWDFDSWLFNRVWLLNGGLTVIMVIKVNFFGRN